MGQEKANCISSAISGKGYLIVRVNTEDRQAIEQLLSVTFRPDYMGKYYRSRSFDKHELKIKWNELKSIIPEWRENGSFNGK